MIASRRFIQEIIRRGVIRQKRKEAAFSWHLAGEFSSLSESGPGKKLLDAIRRFLGEEHREKPKITREELEKKCDKLLLVDDPSVRVMALKAMLVMDYYASTRLALIASWLTSEKTGVLINWSSKKPIGKESLAGVASSYLRSALSLKEVFVFETLEEKTQHWLACLNDSKENLAETRKFAREDLANYLQKVLATPFIEGRKKEVRKALREILKQAFRTENLNEICQILSFLDKIAGKFHYFPCSWLVELTQEVLQEHPLQQGLEFSSAAKKLLLDSSS